MSVGGVVFGGLAGGKSPGLCRGLVVYLRYAGALEVLGFLCFLGELELGKGIFGFDAGGISCYYLLC